jgi:Cys-rich protein (TIGR01571 family)
MSKPAYAEVEQGPDTEDGDVILAHAKPIPFDGIDLETANKVESTFLVRVVAPCALGPGYKLAVKTPHGEIFDVIIPMGGVYRGQVFEAEIHQPIPVTGRFSDGICDCCGPEKGSFCIVAWCCTGIAYAAIMEKLRLTWCAARGSSKNTFAIVTFLWLFFYVTYMINYFAFVQTLLGSTDRATDPVQSNGGSMGMVNIINLGVMVYCIAIMIRTRTAFREKYQIGDGSCCQDCCVVYWCTPCSACQIFRHMNLSGDSPMRFGGRLVEVEIV